MEIFGHSQEILIVTGLLLVLAFEIIMFVHMLRNKDIHAGTKIFWFIGMVVLHPFVALYYFYYAGLYRTMYRKFVS